MVIGDDGIVTLPIMKRPWCCPEPRCSPIHQLKDSDYPNIADPRPGESWSCFGVMDQAITFHYDGVEHTNDLNSCHYSALKGVIRFQENRDDWENLMAAYTRALMRLEKINEQAPFG